MEEDSGAWRAALEKRLFRTCTMRRSSAITRGSSAGRSMRIAWRPPPLWNAVRACSTSTATSSCSGSTESVPASMRPASSRSPIRRAHLPGLFDDDAVERAPLGRVELAGVF